MNDSIKDLEQELRGLTPVAPARRLVHAIRDELATPAATAPQPGGASTLSLWISWSVTAVAASLALVAWLRPPGVASNLARQSPAAEARASPAGSNVAGLPGSARVEDAPADRLMPVGSANYLYGARDEGLVWIDGATPARKLRLQYFDTVRLRAEGDSASVSVTYPREEVRLVPVSVY